jgi:hypothetical protein
MAKKTKISKMDAEIALALRGLGTKEQALDRRVDMDVAKWGEGERAASRDMHRRRSYGLLINSIAVADVDHIDEELMSLAAAVMTTADYAELRKGG